MHNVKETFESEFQNDYDELKPDFRIIVPCQLHRNEAKKLENDFEFKEHFCITQQDIENI